MKAVFVSALLLLSQGAFAQGASVIADKMNVVYIGLENPLTIRSCKFPANSLLVSCNDGEIRNLGGSRYLLTGLTRQGFVTITISHKAAGKVVAIDSARFRARTIPPPIAQIAGKTGGKISAFVLKAQIGIAAGNQDMDCCGPRFEVTHFKMSVIKGNTIIRYFVTDGAVFTQEMKEQLNKLQPGDEVLFSGILVAGAGQNDLSLPALDFTVI